MIIKDILIGRERGRRGIDRKRESRVKPLTHYSFFLCNPRVGAAVLIIGG